MFGNNPVAEKRDSKTDFLVKSIFYTIQGEGPYSGLPAIFIRFGGCNLKCHFCDTDFQSDLETMSAKEICKCVVEENATCDLIVLTGGEPMLQNLSLLIKVIAEELPHITTMQIETAGTVWPLKLEKMMNLDNGPDVAIVVSPKTPKVHDSVRRYARAWKYIISASEPQHNGFPARSTQNRDIEQLVAQPPGEDEEIYLQPMDEQDEELNKANIALVKELAMEHGWRVSLQIHKILGVD